MERLRKIEASLEELHKDFNKQVAALSSDTKEFHTSLIDLTSKYPEHKELIQFIVFVNDKLETNQHLFGEIIVEAFNELVNSKRSLVAELMEKREPSYVEGLWSKIKLQDVKIILIAGAIIVLSIGMMVDTTFATKIISSVLKLFGI